MCSHVCMHASVCICVCVRETQRDRQTERGTDRDRDRKREREREQDRKRGREGERQRQREWGKRKRDKIQRDCMLLCNTLGSGHSPVVEYWTCDWKIAGSSPGRSSRRIFSRVNFLCSHFAINPFHPCVTAVACKRSQSFCYKDKWQVTPKHACTLCMWLGIKWYLVHIVWCTQKVHQDGSSFTWHQSWNNQTML